MQTDETLAHWRTQLLSLISHEIRTPLTTIIAFSQTLQSDDENISVEERKYYLSIIEKESKRISRFLGDLIEISHIESSHEYFHFSKVDYSELFQSVIYEFQERNHIKIEVKRHGKLVNINLDPKRIRTALEVLLSYMARENTKLIEISVIVKNNIVQTTLHRSTGAIPEKDIHELFDIDRQLLLIKTSKSIKAEPVYAASIIRAHQGNIWVTSSPDTGLQISFELPGF